jgi:hypothetical protein|tara:strand:- start:14 stop:472 length:459 start_codon:yes stop_codon:yes gene_type:complete
MVKLYTDAENDYMCKDSRTIPLQLREMLLSIDGENRELALGYVTPNNINQYALSLSKTYNVRATAVVKEYNRLYDMKMGISKLDRTPDLQTQQQHENVAQEEIKNEEVKKKRFKRTKQMMTEARTMGGEDVNINKIAKQTDVPGVEESKDSY